MKLSTVCAFIGLCGLTVAMPAPVEKRNVVVVTDIDTIWITDWVTTTIRVPCNTAKAAASPPPQTSTPASTPTPAPPVSTPTPAPPASTPTPAPPVSTPTPAPPAPPASTPTPVPPASPSPAPASGDKHSGSLTYYTPGLGSCGWTNSDSEMIVAMAESVMTAAYSGQNGNANPLCGKMITISYGGVQQQAKIVDTCPGCQGAQGLDLTSTLFQMFGPLKDGVLRNAEWWYS